MEELTMIRIQNWNGTSNHCCWSVLHESLYTTHTDWTYY